jgi:response regulator RpfG family c-di-GMP phosphodiesterase
MALRFMKSSVYAGLARRTLLTGVRAVKVAAACPPAPLAALMSGLVRVDERGESMKTTDKILFVDDDESILAAHRRALRQDFQIDTAAGGEEALERLTSQGPYAVVVSDLRMPGLDGVKFLTEVRRRVPNAVRIMLTGYSNVENAIAAVNEGQIFRFLTKPCLPDTLAAALRDGLEQYRLLTAEKELLEQTLAGSVAVLTEILGIVNPTAFARASRIRRVVRDMTADLKIASPWQVELAAMLSQIGCVGLAPDLLNKVFAGTALSGPEATAFRQHPRVGHDLIARIPRLAPIAAMISYQDKHFDGSGIPDDNVSRDAIPAGARVLKVALDFDLLTSARIVPQKALVKMQQRIGWYDPAVLHALAGRLGIQPAVAMRSVEVDELESGMTFAEDAYTTSGLILVARGQEVTPSLLLRVRAVANNGGLDGELKVLLPSTGWAPPVVESAKGPVVSVKR